MEKREFLKKATWIAGGFLVNPFNIIAKTPSKGEIVGHGDFKYRVNREWGMLDSGKYPVKDCHEMVMDSKKRIILLTNEAKNNVIIYDKSGKFIDTWGKNMYGAHGLTLHDENGEEFLYIADHYLGEVYKTTMEGKVLMTIKHPKNIGQYTDCQKFNPTETAIGPNGDIYIADGYGSQFILQYNANGEFIRKFGGESAVQEDKFKQAHGVAIDFRDKNNPTLMVTERMKNCFKRFTLDGKFIESIYLPGAYISRPVFDGENLYSGVCWSALKHHYLTPNSGFVTILDKNNKVVSNPGGTKPKYKNGELELMVQKESIFKHCHDVCVDDDKNLYIPQWNAGGIYPYKLERI